MKREKGWQGLVETQGNGNVQKAGRNGCSLRNVSGFANWCLSKLGSSPPTEAGRQKLYLQVLAGTKGTFFWQP